MKDALRAAGSGKATGVILGDCSLAEARAWAERVSIPVWHYAGTLLALNQKPASVLRNL